MSCSLIRGLKVLFLFKEKMPTRQKGGADLIKRCSLFWSHPPVWKYELSDLTRAVDIHICVNPILVAFRKSVRTIICNFERVESTRFPDTWADANNKCWSQFHEKIHKHAVAVAQTSRPVFLRGKLQEIDNACTLPFTPKALFQISIFSVTPDLSPKPYTPLEMFFK